METPRSARPQRTKMDGGIIFLDEEKPESQENSEGSRTDRKNIGFTTRRKLLVTFKNKWAE